MELPDLHPDQVPPFVKSDDDLLRWRLVVWTTLAITHKFDLGFARDLYWSDIATGELAAE